MAGCLEPQPYLWILLSSHALFYAKLKNPKSFNSMLLKQELFLQNTEDLLYYKCVILK